MNASLILKKRSAMKRRQTPITQNRGPQNMTTSTRASHGLMRKYEEDHRQGCKRLGHYVEDASKENLYLLHVSLNVRHDLTHSALVVVVHRKSLHVLKQIVPDSAQYLLCDKGKDPRMDVIGDPSHYPHN